MSAASFRCMGGSLLYRQKPLSRDDMVAFRDLYRDEADAAFKACPVEADGDYERAAVLLGECVNALADYDRWHAAMSPARRAA